MSSDYFDYADYRPISRFPIFAEQDPDDITDYAFNWGGWLGGDTIASSEFILDGLTEVSSSVSGAVTQIFVSGGACGTVYHITNRVVTDGGRRRDKTIAIRVTES